MCCLFGFLNYSNNENKELNNVINCLAREAVVRGSDSTGISYIKNNHLVVYKRPLDAYDMEFKGVENCISVSGHTRHATQGNYKNNYNNHPFPGICNNVNFALCHNGVLWNDKALRLTYDIKKSKIETDSYIAVQLLEKFNDLSFKSIKKMSEAVSGSFCFTITDINNNLWLVKGDNPLSIIHFPKLKLYCYASTENILFTALSQTKLCDAIMQKDFEIIKMKSGDIFKIDKHGNITKSTFDFDNYGYYYDWRDYSVDDYTPLNDDYNVDSERLDDIKFVARSMGIDEKLIDELVKDGFTLDEVEDFIYEDYFSEVM
jgi:glucosamine 6-phosphate synthetase-like amidotransferase/phosphosugar isomerase protein